MLMKKLLFLLLFFSNFAFSQKSDAYVFAKVVLEGKSLKELSSLGVETDHGEHVPGKYLANYFSKTELEKIKAAGFQVKVEIEDWISFFKNQNVAVRIADCPEFPSKEFEHDVPSNFQLGSLAGYFTYEEMLAHLDNMIEKYPDLISSRYEIGNFRTHDNHPIYWFRISDQPNQDENEPEVLYTALHHAREPGSLSQMIYFMWYLLENYATDPQVKFILDNTELYFVPCVNPDGYLYNQLTEPEGGGLWRKNRRPNSDGSYGVDLNRNYGYEWGFDDAGSSPNRESETYRGPEPFSEPETQALKFFCEERNLQVALNYHTFGNLLVYPWGYSDKPTDDSTAFRTFAAGMTRYNSFLPGTGTETVGYTTNGDSDDWMYGENVSKEQFFSMTPEIGTGGFWPNASTIIPFARSVVWQNLVAALIVHHFGWVDDLSDRKIKNLSGSISYQITRSGLKDGVFTVGLEAISPQIISVGSQRDYFTMAPFEQKTDFINFSLAPTTQPGTELKFALWINNGTLTWRDTLTKIYTGQRPVVLSDSGNNMDNWNTSANGWNIDNQLFLSAPSSIGDSPGFDYFNDAEVAMILKEPLDLSEAKSAKLNFWATWEIEARYDYVQVNAITDGNVYTPLCGRYTKTGTRQQDEGQPVFDGNQPVWVEEEMDLDDFTGASEVFLEFKIVSDEFVNGRGFNFDNLELEIELSTGTQIIPFDKNNFTRIVLKPNPASETVAFSIEKITNGLNPERLLIFNAYGGLVEQLNMKNSGGVQLDVQKWNPGLYFYQMVFEQNYTRSGRFSIQR